MNKLGEDNFARLESAIGRWNARVDGAYPDLTDTFTQLEQKLSAITDLLGERRQLPGHLITARMRMDSLNLSPAERERAVGKALDQVEQLEQSLATFHVELQTLIAQANRSIVAGAQLAREILSVQHQSSQGLLSTTDEEIGTPDFQAALAHDLESRNATLEAELAVMAKRLREAEAARAAQGPAPESMQRELAELRKEVETLRAERAVSMVSRVLPEEMASRVQQEAIDDQGRKRPLGMILVRSGLISNDQLETALREQRSSWNRHIGSILIDLGYSDEITIAQTLAAQVKLPFVRLTDERLDAAALRLVSPQLAHHHSSLPLRFSGSDLVVAMANPLDLVALEDLQLATNRTILPVVATVNDIRAALREQYPRLTRT